MRNESTTKVCAIIAVIARLFPSAVRVQEPKLFNVSTPPNYTALSSHSCIRLFIVYDVR